MNTFELDSKYIAGTYARFPVEIAGGKGALAFGADGKEYIDMGSGIAVNIFGFCDEAWQKAVTEQISKFQHTSNLYYSRPCAELAEMLCEKTGMKMCNKGGEKICRNSQRKRILYNSNAEKQLPRQNTDNACGNGSRRISQGFYTADAGFCVCRSE